MAALEAALEAAEKAGEAAEARAGEAERGASAAQDTLKASPVLRLSAAD